MPWRHSRIDLALGCVQQIQLFYLRCVKGSAVENQGLYLTPRERQLLLKSIKTDLRPEYRRRIEIMLLADAGQSQAEICATLLCAQDTARYWMTMVQTGRAHKWDERPMGRPKAINQQYLDRLKELVSNSPRDYGYPFQRWTAQWLGKHLAKELGIQVSNNHITRLLKSMGLSTRQTKKKELIALTIPALLSALCN